jgi:DNA (cytosine-5)-methyltransferase 1
MMKLDWNRPIIMRWREGKAGGGKGGMYSERSFTLATGNDQVLIIDGTRVDDVRVYEDGIVPTVISRYGTGGGNVPMIFDNSEPLAFDEYNNSVSDTHHTLRAGTKQSTGVVMPTLTAANNPSRSPQSSEVTAQIEIVEKVTSVVRRLTPMECERLQGFPDGWTDAQADSNRYKQMGNAVAVPVVNWVVSRMVCNAQ